MKTAKQRNEQSRADEHDFYSKVLTAIIATVLTAVYAALGALGAEML